MIFRKSHGAALARLLAFALLCPSLLMARAPLQRDYLTPQEADLVRDAQVLDRRINIFIKAAERRLLLLADPQAATSKQVQKDVEKWGELPKGSRVELLGDLSRIIEAAITNIDDVAARNAKEPVLPKAVRNLATAAKRFLDQLTTMRTASREERERAAIEESVEQLQRIIEVAESLPAPAKKS